MQIRNPAAKAPFAPVGLAASWSRSRRAPARAQDHNPDNNHRQAAQEHVAVGSVQLGRVQDNHGDQRTQATGHAENDGESERHPDPADAETEQSRADAPARAVEGDLEQQGKRCAAIYFTERRNRGERKQRRQADETDDRVHQPDVLPRPVLLYSLHGQSKAAVNHASENGEQSASECARGHTDHLPRRRCGAGTILSTNVALPPGLLWLCTRMPAITEVIPEWRQVGQPRGTCAVPLWPTLQRSAGSGR